MRMTKRNRLAEFLVSKRTGFNDDDLHTVLCYVRGQQRSMDYDRLPDWSKMIVNMLPVVQDRRVIPEVAR